MNFGDVLRSVQLFQLVYYLWTFHAHLKLLHKLLKAFKRQQQHRVKLIHAVCLWSRFLCRKWQLSVGYLLVSTYSKRAYVSVMSFDIALPTTLILPTSTATTKNSILHIIC